MAAVVRNGGDETWAAAAQNQVAKHLELPGGRGQAPAQSKVGRARVRGPELLAAQVGAGVPPPSVAR